MESRSHSWWRHVDLESQLRCLGFSRRGRGNCYTLNGVVFSLDGNWPVLKASPTPSERAAPLVAQMGNPGLWRCVTMSGRLWRVFELPPSIVTKIDENFDAAIEESPSLFKPLLIWGLQTLDGESEGLHSSSLEDVEALIPPDGLTVQCSAHARQGTLIHDRRRTALRFPIVQRVPETLSKPRRYWLLKTLMEAQHVWRMVRVGMVGKAPETAIQAEVDLTGVPRGALAGLVKIALSALRTVVAWTTAAAEFIAHAGKGCRALDTWDFQPGNDKISMKGGEDGWLNWRS